MALAIDPSQYQQSWRNFLNQSQAVTGRAPMPQEMAAYQTAGLEAEYNQQNTEQQLAIEQQQVTQQGAYQTAEINAQNKATKQAQQGAILQTAISAPAGIMSVYGVGKAANLWGTAAKPTTDTGTTTAQAVAAGGNAAPMSTDTITDPLEGEAADQAFYGGGEQAAAGGAGALSAVGPAAIGGVAGGLLGNALGGKTGGQIGTVLGAAAAGALYGTLIAPGIGTAVGAAVGALVGIGEDVISDISSLF